jgi:hypothetical protein
MMILHLAILLAAPSHASIDFRDIEAVAEQVALPFEAIATTSTPLHLRVVPFQVIDQNDAPLALALTDVTIKRFISNGRVIVATDDSAPYILTGSIFALDSIRAVSFKYEDVVHKTLFVSNQVSFGERRLFSGISRPHISSEKPATSPKFWIGAGAAGKEEARGIIEFAARDRRSRWEASFQASTTYEHTQRTSPTGGAATVSIFRTRYESLRGSYLYPIHDLHGLGGEKLLSFPGFLRAGAGLGLHHSSEKTVGSPLVPSATENHFYALPFVDVGLILSIGSRQELRLGSEYTLPGPRHGVGGYQVGGFAVSGSFGLRLN